MIDQIIEFNIMSPLLGDGYKAGGIGKTIKTHPLVPKDMTCCMVLPVWQGSSSC